MADYILSLTQAIFSPTKTTVMKKPTILIVLIAFAFTLFGQQRDVQRLPSTQIDYLKKSKKEKTWAWILTSVGTAGLLVTLVADAGQATAGGLTTVFSLGTVEPTYKSYNVPYLLSGAAVVGGITLFVMAGKNKRKARAASVLINMEKAPVARQQPLVRSQLFPAVGLKLSL
jgi:hypothetical protein